VQRGQITGAPVFPMTCLTRTSVAIADGEGQVGGSAARQPVAAEGEIAVACKGTRQQREGMQVSEEWRLSNGMGTRSNGVRRTTRAGCRDQQGGGGARGSTTRGAHHRR
jgi:hypothetical protein